MAVFGAVIHAHRRSLDGDAFFAFQIHRIEHLLGHITGRNGPGDLQQTVSQG
jgi:hypothetical protein